MIFINNKYSKIYFQIIYRAKLRTLTEYSEKHHIVPESFYINRTRKGSSGWLDGDPNELSNIVSLTAREHFICHWLLIKMTSGEAKHKMIFAFTMMKCKGVNQSSRYETVITSKIYAIYNEKSSKIKSKAYTGVARNTIQYKFFHITGISETCCILDLCKKYNLPRANIAHLVKKEPGRYHVKGWAFGKPYTVTKRYGSKGANYDDTKYNFQHKDGTVEVCSKYDLYTKYNLRPEDIYAVCNGRQKTAHGWFITN